MTDSTPDTSPYFATMDALRDGLWQAKRQGKAEHLSLLSGLARVLADETRKLNENALAQE